MLKRFLWCVILSVGATPPLLQAQKIGAALHAGLQGIGLDVSYGFSRNLNLRVSASNLNTDRELPISGDVKVNDNDQVTLSAQARVNTQSVGLFADMYPFKRLGLRVTGGLTYSDLTYGVFGEPTSDVTLDNRTFTPEQVGSAELTLFNKSKFVPYAGIGLGRLLPKHRIGLALDAGAYYTNSPGFQIDATGMLEPNEQEGEKVEEIIAPVKLIPSLRLSLSVRIR